MSRDPTRLSIYRLIEAGQLARAALVEPLAERGLEPGDDAILFALGRDAAVPDDELAEITGLGANQLLPRLERLIRHDLITRTDPVETTPGASRLTEKGADLRGRLLEIWQRLDEALNQDLKPRHSRRLRDILDRFTDSLS